MLTDDQLQMYNSIVRNIYKSSNLQELRINLLSGLQPLVPYYSAAFYLINPQTLEFSEPLIYSPHASVAQAIGIYAQLHKNHMDEFFQSNISIVNRSSDYMNYFQGERTEHRSEFTHTHDIHNMACMQVFYKELLIGKLSLHRNHEQSDFSQAEMLILKLLHEHINDCFSNLYTLLRRSNQAEKSAWGLTKREVQIASLISQGKSNKQIARDLGVSENTVKTFLKRIFNKMGVHSRSELINELYKLTPAFKHS